MKHWFLSMHVNLLHKMSRLLPNSYIFTLYYFLFICVKNSCQVFCELREEVSFAEFVFWLQDDIRIRKEPVFTFLSSKLHLKYSMNSGISLVAENSRY